MGRPSAFLYVAERALGLRNKFQDAIYMEETMSMHPVTRNFVYNGGMRVWCMELDPVDARYLLVGTSKSHIDLYDLQELDDCDAAAERLATRDNTSSGVVVRQYDTTTRLGPTCSARSQSIRTSRMEQLGVVGRPQIQFGITAVDWYPVDGGLFVSSGLDGIVKVWDSNTFTIHQEFTFSSQVYCTKFSPISTTHTLIAAVTANREVRLCDMNSNTSIHSLLGHQEEVWSLAWSRANEFQLSTGSQNGEIRMWDIRRSGSTACLLCLNAEGQANAPGRSTLYTNIKQLPSTSLIGASRSHGKKRRRLNGSVEHDRNDPHIAASVSLVRAHAGGVNSLAYTPDGRFLVSSGLDHRLRLWHAKTGEHMFVHYENVRNSGIPRNVQMKIIQEGNAMDGTLLFHPNGTQGELVSYKVHSTENTAPRTRVTAHYRQITCVTYRDTHRQLFTGAEDGLIMKWCPAVQPLVPFTDDSMDNQGISRINTHQFTIGEDNWSEDEDEMDENLQGSGDVFIPPILR